MTVVMNKTEAYERPEWPPMGIDVFKSKWSIIISHVISYGWQIFTSMNKISILVQHCQLFGKRIAFVSIKHNLHQTQRHLIFIGWGCVSVLEQEKYDSCLHEEQGYRKENDKSKIPNLILGVIADLWRIPLAPSVHNYPYDVHHNTNNQQSKS